MRKSCSKNCTSGKVAAVAAVVKCTVHKRRLNYGNGTRTHNHSVCKQTLNYLAKLAKWLSCVVSRYLLGHFTVCSYCVTYAFQSESSPESFGNSVFVYELNGCEFKSRWSHLIFQYRACFLARSFLTFRQLQSVDSL